MEPITTRFLTLQTIKALLLIIVTLFVLTNIGCSKKKEKAEHLKTEYIFDKTTFSFTQDKDPYKLLAEYKIAPGDELDVLFYIKSLSQPKDFQINIGDTITVKYANTPELNVESQMVLPNGNISLPYIGEVLAVNKKITELQKELEERYSKILQNPQIFITVPEFSANLKDFKTDLYTSNRGLSKLTTVRPDGYVTFPMVGNVYVAYRTVPDVNKELNEAYEKLYPELRVDLFLNNHSGSLVYVMGEVKSPNAYTIIKPITVFEALTLAGGMTSEANGSSIIVMRRHEKKIISTIVDIESVLNLNTKKPIFFLQPDDIIYVQKQQ